MSETDYSNLFGELSRKTPKPDPMLDKDESRDLNQPQEAVIEKRQQTLENDNKGSHLSRGELESLLDLYYASEAEYNAANNQTTAEQHHAHTAQRQHHARTAGGRMVRNLAFASSFALLLGFGFGFYTLSQQGGETPLGQKFNLAMNGLWQQVTSIPSFLTQDSPAQANLNQANLKQANPAKPAKQGTGQVVTSSRKPIKTASLVVADATGTVHAGIPLKLSLKMDSNIALVEVKIMNVPGDAVLTAGTRRRDGVWVLQPEDLADVALVLSSDRRTPLRLDVELVEAKTGQLLSPTREIKVAILPIKPFTIGGL